MELNSLAVGGRKLGVRESVRVWDGLFEAERARIANQRLLLMVYMARELLLLTGYMENAQPPASNFQLPNCSVP